MSNSPDGQGVAAPSGVHAGNRRKGVLIVVSGPSGAGKSTLLDRFLREDSYSQFSISYTTRQKRVHEVDGKDFHVFDERPSSP
jgi:guanylate kinase